MHDDSMIRGVAETRKGHDRSGNVAPAGWGWRKDNTMKGVVLLVPPLAAAVPEQTFECRE